MRTYTVEFSKAGRHVWLQELEGKLVKRQDMCTFPEKIIELHQINDFFKKLKKGNVEFRGIKFNVIKFDDREVKFKTNADFETVAYKLLRFKNKFEVSMNLMTHSKPEVSFDYQCFLKVEYFQHFDKSNGDFLVCKNFYANNINATRENKTAYFFDMLMSFYHGEKEYNGIFVDTEAEADFEFDLNKKMFFSVYTDLDINELANYCMGMWCNLED
jgi:hypothetical protein